MVQPAHFWTAQEEGTRPELQTEAVLRGIQTVSSVNNAKKGTLKRGALQYSGLRSSQILSNLLKSPSDGLKSSQILSMPSKNLGLRPRFFELI